MNLRHATWKFQCWEIQRGTDYGCSNGKPETKKIILFMIQIHFKHIYPKKNHRMHFIKTSIGNYLFFLVLTAIGQMTNKRLFESHLVNGFWYFGGIARSTVDKVKLAVSGSAPVPVSAARDKSWIEKPNIWSVVVGGAVTS